MVISAWVLTMDANPMQRVLSLSALRRTPGLNVGELTPHGRVAVAAESADIYAAESMLHELRNDAGVVHVDVVGIWFEQAA